ncbi:MAG: ImmA/IrrE family metallo-endopeptidase [Phycisphaerae bacterium]|nr:ImmA/IrrE family metallo-endopeptidase [Phycisphaerae bacterium]
MKSYKKDKYGIPIIGRDQVEDKAEEFLKYFNVSIYGEPTGTPLMDICTRMNSEFNIVFVFDQDLGISTQGKKILGRFQQKPRIIFIDSSLEKLSPRWRFTLCHELGHLVFHRNVDLVSAKAKDTDTEDDIDGESPPSQSRTNSDWMEWQAHAFSASILLPRLMVQKVVFDSIKELGLKIDFGPIYLDNQPCNQCNYGMIIHKLTELFGASKKAVEIRLKKLKLLVDVRDQNVEHIHSLLREG